MTLSIGERLYILFHQVMFLLTGLMTTLGCQWLFYKGAATGDSYLTQLSQYLGMILVGLLIPSLLKRKSQTYSRLATHEESIRMESLDDNDRNNEKATIYVEGAVPHSSLLKMAILDVVANFCVTLGFSLIGSGMYQVIYSSVVIWCAILTYFLMDRTLTKVQWFSIFGTSAGLAICSLGNMNSSDLDSSNGFLLMFGTLMTLGGTFFYSCIYVYSDYMLSKQDPPPLPARICCYIGMYSTVISLIWISIYTLPRYDQLIHIDDNTSNQVVWGMYLLVTVANGTHSWNYYELIDRTGSVATGILQGLRAVIVYGLSHAWYCSSDSAQCFTVYKGFGSLMVILCVLLFTIGGNGLSK
ncbi:uncharacterized protein BX664DRAFT_339766 [Halteromyces radiatus]|uniref:uncharacterized protein n=1 Tax=Halteromyces radiatus TaxID=101107 RepID=UPI0022206C54|nr:uncharacterized protein BX664DRAFT_339766 [Halteromyces radiatus]KAI8083075.1 hypothetical protein BX664DRAFT_339766 [Halteromyces radiatus]